MENLAVLRGAFPGMRKQAITRFMASVAMVATLSCDASQTTGPSTDLERHPPSLSPIEADSTNLLGLFGPRPLYCPSSETHQTSAIIGALGGILSVGGVTVSIPLGALLGDVTVVLTVPASNNMEIDISVEGHESWVFEQPIVVTVPYTRCRLTLLQLLTPIVAWHFDPVTRELLAPMPSVDNKLARTVTFTTGHLSGYILAN
jgi:hypothetical protein